MYLGCELGWPHVRWYGWVKRQPKRLRSGVRSSRLDFEKEVTPRQLSQWSLGDRRLCFFWGIRRDLPRRPQSCAKDRRNTIRCTRYSPLICARWTQVSFCTFRLGRSLAECL